jgi:hypothetical protein
MIKLENVVLASPEQMEFIIEGMRNPMNSWDRSDSYIDAPNKNCNGQSGDSFHVLGENDHDLMQRLADAGSVHRKYMRMMPVYARITAPLYWWKEFDTYKVGTVSNSCSTMHKIHEKEFTLEDFSCDQLSTGFEEGDDFINSFIVMSDGDSAHDYELYPRGVLEIVIEGLNMKVKVFDSRKSIDLENQINEFIKDKVVYDIRQSTFTVPAKIDKDGKTVRVDIFSRVIVMYDDVKRVYRFDKYMGGVTPV